MFCQKIFWWFPPPVKLTFHFHYHCLDMTRAMIWPDKAAYFNWVHCFLAAERSRLIPGEAAATAPVVHKYDLRRKAAAVVLAPTASPALGEQAEPSASTSSSYTLTPAPNPAKRFKRTRAACPTHTKGKSACKYKCIFPYSPKMV